MDKRAKSDEPTALDGRRLYLSLSGTERREWKVGLGMAAAAAFGVGLLMGAGAGTIVKAIKKAIR